MKMIRSLFAILFVLVACAAWSQGNTKPSVKVVLPKQIKPGAKFQGTVEVTFAEGLHGYQNPPTDKFQIPVKLAVDAKGFAIGKIVYPKGALIKLPSDSKPSALYQGTIKIQFTATAPKGAGMNEIKATVSYQQCNEQACFPPDSVTGTAKLLVK